MLNIDDRILDEATSDELYLMLHIARYMKVEDNTAFPSLSTLCRVTKWSKPFVIKIKQQCIEKKMLSCQQKFLKNGGHASNVYTIETDYISLFINAKGRKGVEILTAENSKKSDEVVNNIYKGGKQNLQGSEAEVVNKNDKGSKQYLQALVNGVDSNILVTSLTISEFNKLNIEEENFEKNSPTPPFENDFSEKKETTKRAFPPPPKMRIVSEGDDQATIQALPDFEPKKGSAYLTEEDIIGNLESLYFNEEERKNTLKNDLVLRGYGENLTQGQIRLIFKEYAQFLVSKETMTKAPQIYKTRFLRALGWLKDTQLIKENILNKNTNGKSVNSKSTISPKEQENVNKFFAGIGT